METETFTGDYTSSPSSDRPAVTSRFGKIIPNRIFIGGLAKDTTEEDLERVFACYGNIKSIKIVMDRAGVSKGYGFITFENIEEAQRIQKDVDSVLIKDVKIKIAQAVRKQNIINMPGTHNGFNPHTACLPDPATLPLLYQQSLQYPPFYQCSSLPMGMPLYWQPYF